MKKTLTWLLSLVMLITTLNLPCFSINANAGDKTELLPYVYARHFDSTYYQAWTEELKEERATELAQKTAKAYFGAQSVDAEDYSLEVVAKDGLTKGDETAATTFVATLCLTAAGEEKYIFSEDGLTEKEFKVNYRLLADNELPFVSIWTPLNPVFYGPKAVTVDISDCADEAAVKALVKSTVEDSYSVYFGGKAVDSSCYTVTYEPANEDTYCDTYNASIALTSAGKDEYTLEENAEKLPKEISVRYVGTHKHDFYDENGDIDVSKQDCTICHANNIAYSELNIAAATVTYNGKAQTADITGIDVDNYTVEGNVMTDAGKYEITLTGKNDYAGTRKLEWTIEKATPDYTVPAKLTVTCGDKLSSVSLSGTGFEWTDANMVLEAGSSEGGQTVTKKAKYVPEDTDNYNVVEDIALPIKVTHALSVSSNGDDTHSVKCSKCKYSGAKEKCAGGTATDKDRAVCSKCKTAYGTLETATPEKTMPATVKLSATKAVYQGFKKSVAPKIIVKDSDGKTVDKSNYDIVMPKTVVAVGEYTYHVIFKNDYAGEKKLKFTIVPKTAAIKSVKVGRRKMKLTFSKNVSSTGGTYYEYSYRIKGTSKWKTVKTKKQTVTVSKLKKGKKYEVKVRAYKVVNKKKISGEWSKVKTTSKIK